MKSKIAAAALILLPFTGQHALAEEAVVEEKSALTLSAELGFLFKTGNTKSGDIKAGINLKYEKEQWLHLVAFNALAKKLETEDDTTGEDSFESTDNKWDILGQTNYSLEEGGKNYLYGSAFYQQDKFSTFSSQSSASVGWGRHWFETKTSSFFADIGPGVKYDRIRAVNATLTDPAIIAEGKTDVIVQAQALYTKKINEFVEFKQYFVAKQAFESDKNSIYKSETSLTTKLIDSLSFKFNFVLDYDTEVAKTDENLNTETSLTLVYSF